MTLEEFNKSGNTKAEENLFRCCGSMKWVKTLMEHFPFGSKADLRVSSDRIWFSLGENDWLEAFSHHPKIGSTTVANKWAAEEQSGVAEARKETIMKLQVANESYEKNFGFIFIVCATGKSASEMLATINKRMQNDRAQELHIAAIEQNKITHIRIDKLLS